MWLRAISRHKCILNRVRTRPQWLTYRCLMTLAIETSCDDTSVAIVEKSSQHGHTVAQIHFHKKVTSNNTEYKGVHPLVSLQSHQENLASLVSEAIGHLPPKENSHAIKQACITTKQLPDFISVTRGPGMRSNLTTGLDLAKGLAVAWQAHALTPRLVSALEAPTTSLLEPHFPFLSVLASGGHTLLIQSTSLVDHCLLGSTNDIAIGECLDKVARILLPADLLQSTKSTMYGVLLEQFALAHSEQNDTAADNSESLSHMSASSQPNSLSGTIGYSANQYLENSGRGYSWYEVPANHEAAIKRNMTKWGWSFDQPLTKSQGGTKINSIELSFSGLLTAAERVIQYHTDPITRKRTKVERAVNDISIEEKRDIAREIMRAAFEHVAYRVILALRLVSQGSSPQSIVLAGGVAANSLLRHILASTLCARGYHDMKLYFPPPKYCTDNAAMIAWTGLEMFEAGYIDPVSIRAIRKWPLDQLLDPIVDG
ncbi:glycoprotease family-domain-containing protein [Phaeosphaeriaceae sp. PMI808]|nr:glycoprotease family-domain-containing protein [Phaeosphaeriaceae sp. PMI808]